MAGKAEIFWICLPVPGGMPAEAELGESMPVSGNVCNRGDTDKITIKIGLADENKNFIKDGERELSSSDYDPYLRSSDCFKHEASFIVPMTYPGYYFFYLAYGYHNGTKDDERDSLRVVPITNPLTPWPRLSGKVVDTDGNPLSGVSVKFNHKFFYSLPSSTTTKADGTYEFNRVIPGNFVITFTTPEGDSKDYSRAFGPGDIVGLSPTFEAPSPPLEKIQIVGTVWDRTDGSPLGGVAITCNGISTTSDINGEYSFDNLEPKDYTLTFTKEGYDADPTTPEEDPFVDSISYDPADILPYTVNGFLWSIPPSEGKLHITVLKKYTTTPLEGVRVLVGDEEGYTDANGFVELTFVFTEAMPDIIPYSAAFSKDGYKPTTKDVEVKRDFTIPYTVFMEPEGEPPPPPPDKGTVEITVTNSATDAPIPNVVVTIDTISGSTNESGWVRLENIPAGSQSLSLECDGFVNYSSPVEVLVDTVVYVTRKMDPDEITGTLHLIVTEKGTETLLENVEVTVYGQTNYTNSEGFVEFILPAPETGSLTYSATLTKTGYKSTGKEVEITKDYTSSYSISMEPETEPPPPPTGTGVIGYVADDATGEKIPDAHVFLGGRGDISTIWYETESSAIGGFEFKDIEPGTYDIMAIASGYATREFAIGPIAEGCVEAWDMKLERPPAHPLFTELMNLIEAGFPQLKPQLDYIRWAPYWIFEILIGDFFRILFHRNIDGTPAEPSTVDWITAALTFVPAYWLVKLSKRLCGRVAASLAYAISQLGLDPVVAKFGAGCSRIIQAIPKFSRGETCQLSRLLKDLRLADADALIKAKGELSTAREFIELVAKDPEAWRKGVFSNLEVGVSRYGDTFSRKIPLDEAVKTYDTYILFRKSMLDTLGESKGTLLAKASGVDDIILRASRHRTFYKEGTDWYADAIIKLRRIGADPDFVDDLVLEGGILAPSRSIRTWIGAHKFPIFIAFWIPIDNVPFWIWMLRQGGVLPPMWRAKWNDAYWATVRISDVLEEDPCNPEVKEKTLEAIAKLDELIEYATENPLPEDLLGKLVEGAKAVWGLSIGDPAAENIDSLQLQRDAFKLALEQWDKECGEEPKPPVPEQFEVLIREVVDGDTARIFYEDEDGVMRKDSIRTVGINAPELGKSVRETDGTITYYPAEFGSKESKEWLGRQINGLHVTLFVDPDNQRDTTKGHRVLALVRKDPEDPGSVNLDSVREGWSFYYPYADNKYVDDEAFKAAELEAKEAKRGIWAGGFGELYIRSIPSGAKVFINATDQFKITPETLELTPDTYEVTVKIEGYADKTQIVEMEIDVKKELFFDLTEIPEEAKLTLASTPTKAEIFLDGEATGLQTPETLTFTKEDFAGEETKTASIELRLENHKTWKRDITLVPGIDRKFEVNLEPEKELGKIKVTSKPPNATVLVKGLAIPPTLTPVTLDLDCPDHHSIVLKLDGYAEFTFDDVYVQCDKIAEVHKDLLKEETKGRLKISSSPSYARIWVDGKDYELTPKAIELEPKAYSVTLKKTGFQDFIFENVTIERGHQRELYAELETEETTKGSLYVFSSPSYAEIYLKPPGPESPERFTGYTPETIKSLDPGVYTVSLERTGYVKGEGQITIEAGKRKEFFLELEKIELKSGLSIRSSPPNAEILINNVSTSYLTPEKISLEPDDYTLKLTLSGFKEFSAEVTVPEDTFFEVYAKLEPIEEEIGTAKITSKPTSAYIMIDTIDIGRVTPATVELAPGTHTIAVSKTGFGSSSKEITIERGKQTDAHFDLTEEEIPETQGLLVVRSKPTNANISIDETDIGRLTPEDITLDEKTVTVSVSKAGYESQSKEVEIKAGEKTELFFTLTKTPGEEAEEEREESEGKEALVTYQVPAGWPWTLAGVTRTPEIPETGTFETPE